MARLLVLLLGLVVAVQGAWAKVTVEQAERLKGELTPMGAERSGNYTASIPAWRAEPFTIPASYQGVGSHYPNPYASDEVLFKITAENYAQYADQLSDGLKAMFRKYPDTFYMNIYPSHRDVRYSDWSEQNVYDNALRANLARGGSGVVDAWGGIPFPIPKNGLHLIWNHILKERPTYYEASYRSAAVYPTGSISYGAYQATLYAPFMDRKYAYDAIDPMTMPGGVFIIKKSLPARERGQIVLVHEFLDQTRTARAAWTYIPGTRRVRRAPSVGYDTPDGPGGLRTTDGADSFNGAVDRYRWTMKGKREMFIPYNQYSMDDPNVTYDQLLKPGHVNPEYMRYELHRVWVLQADLKEGKRHVYSKRMMYMDEDSWHTTLSDHFDGHGNLWRTTVINSLFAWDLPGLLGRSEIYYDLQVGAYQVDKLVNEEAKTENFDAKPRPLSYFTPSNLRKIGRQ